MQKQTKGRSYSSWKWSYSLSKFGSKKETCNSLFEEKQSEEEDRDTNKLISSVDKLNLEFEKGYFFQQLWEMCFNKEEKETIQSLQITIWGQIRKIWKTVRLKIPATNLIIFKRKDEKWNKSFRETRLEREGR